MIVDPVTLTSKALVQDARDLMAKHRIGGIPIIDEHGTLQGIVTNRDLRFESDMNKKLREYYDKAAANNCKRGN